MESISGVIRDVLDLAIGGTDKAVPAAERPTAKGSAKE